MPKSVRRARKAPRKKGRQSRTQRNDPPDGSSSSNDGSGSDNDSDVDANAIKVNPTVFLGKLMKNLTREQRQTNAHCNKAHTWKVDKESALSSLTSTQKLLMKIVLREYKEDHKAGFKIDSISFPRQFKLIIK